MLSNFSAMFFTANPNSKDAMNQQDAVMMSSLAVLTLKAEVARLTSNNSVLHAENEQLQGQVDTMELEMDRLKHTIHKLKEASAKVDKGKGRDYRPNRTSHGGNAWQGTHDMLYQC
jgi:cell division protein FtsB